MGYYGKFNQDSFDKSAELAYDLRQTYAEIIGVILKRIVEARYTNDYSLWYKALEDLFIEVNQKLTEQERKDYDERIMETNKILNQYTKVYQRKERSKEGLVAIQKTLRGLELWIKERMEDHKMFGAKDTEDDGL